MIRLTADSIVLTALKTAIPKTNKAEQYLTKYVQNLEREINAQIFQPRNALMVSKKQYWASLTNIQENGGQIWSLGNKRVHRWLAENGMALVEQINKGQANNITGEIAIIKLTNQLTVQDDEDLETLQSMDDVQLDQHLSSVPPNEIGSYQQLLSPYLNLSKKQKISDYDLLDINTASTKKYIKTLVRSKVGNKNRTEYRKALRILRLAQINNDVFPQKKRKSAFGRTYYEGVSIQSVNKDLRKAILEGCYEYDVKSSVVSWKLAFADELLASDKNRQSFDDAFWAIYYFLTYKKEFFDDLQNRVFDGNADWSLSKQKNKIKEALTALSFGAKLADHSWTENGKDVSSSLVGIFSERGFIYEDEIKRFMDATEVAQFKKQQSKLDKFIINKFLQEYPFLSEMTELQTKTGRRANSKVLAWLYQQAETKMMDIVRSELKTLKVAVRANIHDAIVIDRQLTADEIERIKQKIKNDPTNLAYFDLGETLYQ